MAEGDVVVTVNGAMAALEEEGFERDHARFLAVVVLAGGVFTWEALARWVGEEGGGGGKTQRFLDGLSRAWKAKYPRDTGIGSVRVGRARLHQCVGKGMYRAVGLPNTRYRRSVDTSDVAGVMRRVIRVCAVLEWWWWPWVFSAESQVVAFEAVGVLRSAMPSRIYGSRKSGRQVFFVDRPVIAVSSDRCVILHALVEEEPGMAGLKTWWRQYSGLVEALGEQGIQVSLRVARSPGAGGSVPVEEQVALWEADGSTVEAVRSIWISREELRRLDGGHPEVVRAYGGADGVEARRKELAGRIAIARGELGGGVADTEVVSVEGVPASW